MSKLNELKIKSTTRHPKGTAWELILSKGPKSVVKPSSIALQKTIVIIISREKETSKRIVMKFLMLNNEKSTFHCI